MTQTALRNTAEPPASAGLDSAVRDDLRRKWRLILIANGVALGWILFAPFGQGAASLLANTVFPVWGAVTCAVLGRRFRHARPAVVSSDERPRMRLASWLLMAAGSVTYAVGSVIYYYYDLVLDEPPFPSVADVVFLFNYPLVIAGILLLPGRRTSTTARGKVMLDTVITTVAAGTFSWYFLLGPILQREADSLLACVLSSAYTVFDVAGLFCVLLLSGRLTGSAERYVILPLVVGNVCNILADSLWGYRILHELYVVGEPLDVLWPLGFMMICLAARAHRLAPYRVSPTAVHSAEPAVPHTTVGNGVALWRSLVPYALVPFVVALLVYDHRTQDNAWLSYGVYGGALLLLCLLLARQLLAIYENHCLTRRLVSAVAEMDAGHRSLESAHARLAAISRASIDGVLSFTDRHEVLECNAAAERMFGFAAAHVRGMSVGQMFELPGGDGSPADGCGTTKLAGRRVEATAVRADRSTFPVELAVARIDVEGPANFVAFVRDLTESKRAQAERDQLHDKLIDASRRAGMAEVASGVLHNVGNVLNSVNVSAAVVSDALRRSEVASLKKAVDLLDQHRDGLGEFVTSDERGRLLPAFLVEVTRVIAMEQDAVVAELRNLDHGVEHIKRIIEAQQTHAKSSAILDEVVPAELMESAVKMQNESLSRHDVRVVRRYACSAPLLLDRHAVLQILVNLLSNAKQAVKATDRTDRAITLSVERATAVAGRDGDAAAAVVRFTVADNGVGIEPHLLTAIFGHGFTTRRNGHGFGLHSAANLAREMGGSLRATSDGPGAGATFVLELPPANSSARVNDPNGQLTPVRTVAA